MATAAAYRQIRPMRRYTERSSNLGSAVNTGFQDTFRCDLHRNLRIKDSRGIDPACGSGSLLLKAAKILGKENVRQGFYGQEINITTCNLTDDNNAHIVDAFTKWEDAEYLCRLVPYDEVKEQGYNLSVSTYVEQKDTREKIDIVKLNAEIREIVPREQTLRDEIDRIIAEIEGEGHNEQ